MYPGIMVAFTGTLFGYIYTSITGDSLNWAALAVVCVVFAGVSGYIAFRGVSGSTMTAIVINVIQITTLILVSILFLAFRIKHPHADYENASAGSVVIPKQFVNVLFQSTIAILLLVGFESVTALGAEAKRPEKDIKRGVLLSLIIQGGLCYMIQYFAANFAVGGATVSSGSGKGRLTGYTAAGLDAAPIGTMLHNVGDDMLGGTGKTLSLIVATTVMIALIGTTLACLNTGVRVTYAMARDKEMPAVLGLLHGRFATPHGGVLILTIISAVLGVYGVNPANANNVTQITVASNTGTFLVYGFSCLIAITAFAHRNDRHLLKHYIVPSIGAVMNVVMLFAVVYLAFASGGATAKNAIISLGIVAVWIALGVAWVVLNPSKKGDRLILTDPPRRETVNA
jgi:basic amino acid/polyamine antiporter, APA family